MAFYYGGDAYRDLWVSTKPYYESKLLDMLPRSHPLLATIAGNNNIKGKELKGKRFVQPILARPINSVKEIGYRAQITAGYHDLLEVIEVEPKLSYQGVEVNEKELAVNSSNELVDLLSINERAVREGYTRYFAKTIYESGYNLVDDVVVPNKMNGLAYMISENPYAADLYVYNLLRGGKGHVAAVNEGNEFWRNRAGEFVTTGSNKTWDPADSRDVNAQKLIDAMNMMILVLNGVSEVGASETMDPVVDGIYMNYSFYNLFQYARFKLLHINNVASENTDVGFVKLEHMGIPCYLDKYCPPNKIYFIDSRQIELLYVPGENFKRTVKEMPEYFSKRYITSFLGNYLIHKARNCGVITWNEVTNELPDTANVCKPDLYIDGDYSSDIPVDVVNKDSNVENTGYSGSGEPKFETPPTPHKKK